MNKPEISSFVTEENIEVNANLYRAKNKAKNITVIYFHGGGLLYGTRDDLPELYIHQFLASGYDFLALDYPLAPESKLDTIIKTAFETLCYYLKNVYTVHGVENNKYVLFGRSAGAYLCFMLCDLLMKTKAMLPMSLISLYGYARLDEVSFHTPSKYYNRLASMPDERILKVIENTPVTYGPMSVRFSLYIKARQEGTWIKCLCGKENPVTYSLDEKVLRSFPPTILAAATLDPDVPYKMTKTLHKQIPNSHLITIYREAHDFDRDVNDEAGRRTYEEIVKWLDDRI